MSCNCDVRCPVGIDERRITQAFNALPARLDCRKIGANIICEQQFRAILASADGPIGRKLDFLIQEMNRETNTIASKASSAEAAQLVVDMKSEIEKLREQVQNIE